MCKTLLDNWSNLIDGLHSNTPIHSCLFPLTLFFQQVDHFYSNRLVASKYLAQTKIPSHHYIQLANRLLRSSSNYTSISYCLNLFRFIISCFWFEFVQLIKFDCNQFLVSWIGKMCSTRWWSTSARNVSWDHQEVWTWQPNTWLAPLLINQQTSFRPICSSFGSSLSSRFPCSFGRQAKRQRKKRLAFHSTLKQLNNGSSVATSFEFKMI